MKKVLLGLTLVLGTLMGCSKNEIYINNSAQSGAPGSIQIANPIPPVVVTPIQPVITNPTIPNINGLISYYPFNGNANEYVTNNNNGSIIEAYLTTDKNNNVANAYSFNGSTGYISLPNPFFNGQRVTQFTLSINFYLNELKMSNCLWSKNGYWQGLTLGVDYNGKIYLEGSVPNQQYQYCKSNASIITTGKWYNLIIVYDNTICKFYLNGTEIQVNMLTTNTTGGFIGNRMAGYVDFAELAKGNSLSTNMFGATNSISTGNVGFLNGKLDEFRLYNRILNSSEINYLSTK